MYNKDALVAAVGLLMMITPLKAEAAMNVQIGGTQVENFCYFDGTVYSPGAIICDPLYDNRVLTCQPKGNKLPVPPGFPAGTATLNSTVAGWTGAEDAKCARK
jgi:hypothetical protein